MPVHTLISEPAVAVGVVPHVITRVEVGFVPVQPPLPVTVNVAVKLPEALVGVKVAKAGLAFCTQLPKPPPPVHALPLLVPPELAPVIAIAAMPVHTLISEPAVAVGVVLTVTFKLLVPKHPLLSVTV
jgi:hypothetical protein